MTDDSTGPTQPESPQPASDLRSLDRLTGTWHVFDPSGEDTVEGQVSYEWMEGGFFLLQHVDLNHQGRRSMGIEVIGHERQFGGEPSEDIKSRYYGGEGDTLDYVYELVDDTLTIWGGERGSPAYFRGTFDDPDSLTGAWVWPGGGYQSRMTRTKEA